jgi:hypothetical protein
VNAKRFYQWLLMHDACRGGLAFAEGRTPRNAWQHCDRPDWLLWLLHEIGWEHLEVLREFSVEACRHVEPLMPETSKLAWKIARTYGYKPDVHCEVARNIANVLAATASHEAMCQFQDGINAARTHAAQAVFWATKSDVENGGLVCSHAMEVTVAVIDAHSNLDSDDLKNLTMVGSSIKKVLALELRARIPLAEVLSLFPADKIRIAFPPKLLHAFGIESGPPLDLRTAYFHAQTWCNIGEPFARSYTADEVAFALYDQFGIREEA